MPTAPAPIRESAIARNALVVLAVLASGATLYWLAPILTPLALALFLAVMVDGFARVLNQRLTALPKRAALPLALVLSILLFGGTAFFVAINATSFVSQLLNYAPKLDAIIAHIAVMAGVKNPPTALDLIKGLDPTTYLGLAARAVQDFASTSLFVLVYLGLILASRSGWDRKAIGLFHNREERQDAVVTFLRIRDGVERYLFVQTITGLMVAGLSWAAMAAVGLHDSLLWALLIFLAVYIPVAGGVFAGCAPPPGDRGDHRQCGLPADAGAQPQHRPGGGAGLAGLLERHLGRHRRLSFDAADRHGHGHPGAVRRKPVDRRDPFGQRRSATA
jgi:predicted PurR-regulated permease PerM